MNRERHLMSLREVIQKTAGHLESGVLEIEAHVRQYVIDPILGELGWDVQDPSQVLVEHKVDTGYVDYALLDKGKPVVFIEAKKVGNLRPDAEEQLFKYAANRGIPLLVLTDGNQWDFYLAMAAGEPSERRFCRIELGTLDNARLIEYDKSFRKFLGKQQVGSGSARRDAESHHEDAKRRESAKAELGNAWQGLLSPPDGLLRELLTEEVESICGTRPHQQDVETFLRNIARSVVNPMPQVSQQSGPTRTGPSKPSGKKPQVPRAAQSKARTIVGFQLHGNEVVCDSARSTLVTVMQTFQSQDPGFLLRLFNDPRNRTKKRVFVSRNRGELYEIAMPDSVYKNLGGGWWLGANMNIPQIIQKIKLACDIAGVRYGTQLTLLEEDT
ncbi:MAG: type I restriction endonuclease [bacterium]|nr:type I restriction endonuclease [bacterium]